MPNLKEDRSSLAAAANIIMLILAFLAVGLRLVARRLSVMNYWWDDLFAVLALVRVRGTFNDLAHPDQYIDCIYCTIGNSFLKYV